MKAYKLELLVIDFENYGPESLSVIAENARGLDPTVMSIEGRDIGEWTDDHPLNKHDTAEAEYKRLFAPVSAPTAGERQSIADDPEFNELLAAFGHNWTEGDEKQAGSRAALIAHIDTLLQGARSAGDAVPAGFKLVPIKADAMMLRAGMRHFSDKRSPANKAWECYRDMIGAAPAPGNTEKPGLDPEQQTSAQFSALGNIEEGENA